MRDRPNKKSFVETISGSAPFEVQREKRILIIVKVAQEAHKAATGTAAQRGYLCLMEQGS